MSEPASPRMAPAAEPQRTGNAARLVLPLLLATLALAITVLTVNICLVARSIEGQRQTTREHAFWVICQPGHTVAQRTSAFHLLAAEGNKEWRSAQLSEMNLAKIALPGADLTACAFQRANLASANLAGAKLGKAAFDLCDLSDADLPEAGLSEAHLYRAILKDANLRRANLRAAVLQEVKAEKVDLMAADLSDADCMMANFSHGNLSGANLSGARLEAAVLKCATLTLARLNDANLNDTDFTDSNWWRARGLTSEQITAFKKKFPPSESASPALKEDFQKWAATAGK